MSSFRSPIKRFFQALQVLLILPAVSSAQSWQPLQNQPTFGASTALLLTDGAVMVHNGGTDWWRLTPDAYGSYVSGTWSLLESLPAGYSPLYFASAVLPDGRVIVEGGEFNFLIPGNNTMGAIFDPTSDTWTSVPGPNGWCCISDAPSVVLANGQFMLANGDTRQQARLNATTLTWTETGIGKADSNNEEGWTLLPNKQVLTVDTRNSTNSEVYVPASGKWHSAGSTIVELSAGAEIGPAVLRPDGTVFAMGATGHNAIFNYAIDSWKPGPDFPMSVQGQLSISDGPAALLPNGNVLCDTSPSYSAPSYFFEFDGTSFKQVPAPPNSSSDPSFYGRMLVLPTGQILFTDGSTDVEICTPSGSYKAAWRPRIQFAPSEIFPGASYAISGHYFNGFSQGAAYGDNAQTATNYPLVRIINRATGHVFYSRTHNHSFMGVAFGGVVSTRFDVPPDQEPGVSDLFVVANGIPSAPVTVNVQ